jgi:hypothetical protein
MKQQPVFPYLSTPYLPIVLTAPAVPSNSVTAPDPAPATPQYPPIDTWGSDSN